MDEYKGWTDQKAEEFLNRLVDYIVNYKLYPIECVVVKSTWNQLSYGERRYMTGGIFRTTVDRFRTSGAPSKVYYVPFQYCVIIAASHCGKGQKVHFFFGLNEQLKGYALELYGQIKNEPGVQFQKNLGDIAFLTPRDAVQLQAADLLAYVTYQYCLKETATSMHNLSYYSAVS